MDRANDDSQAQEPFNAESSAGPLRQSEQPIRFAGSVLGEKPHICAFFNSLDEEYRVLLPFIKEDFTRGEKAFHVVNPQRRHEHEVQLQAVGIDVT